MLKTGLWKLSFTSIYKRREKGWGRNLFIMSRNALFSVRIKHLTEHLKENHKDFVTARSLKALVGQRRRLLDYLIRKDINRYRAIIAKKELGIRK